MKKFLSRFAFAAWVSLTFPLLIGCAPGLDRQIPVPVVDTPVETATGYQNTGVQVQLRPFVDDRPTMAIAVIDGREIPAEGDVAAAVHDAFQSYLDKHGVITSNPNAPIVSGQITEWLVRVAPGFPASAAEAEATLVISVSNLENQTLYRGTYSGTTAVKNPLLTQSKISEALGAAMQYAIAEVMKDEELLRKISRAHHPIS